MNSFFKQVCLELLEKYGAIKLWALCRGPYRVLARRCMYCSEEVFTLRLHEAVSHIKSWEAAGSRVKVLERCY